MWRRCVVGATSQQPRPRAKAHLPDVALVVQEAEEVLLDVADEVADNAGSGTGGVRIRCRLRTRGPAVHRGDAGSSTIPGARRSIPGALST